MAASFSHAAAQDKGKGHAVALPAPPSFHILNQVNDEVIDDLQLHINDTRILIPFTVGVDTHCFLGPVESLKRVNKKLPFFPSAEGEDLLINQALNISFFINKKLFKNKPKINPRGFDFTAWYQRFAPTKNAVWGALGIQELLRLSHFSPATLPWMIRALTCFWNRTTNNFHLPCGMVGMSLLNIAAITGLPISPPNCTPDMQSERRYSVTLTNSYSDFIAHNMCGEGTEITNDEYVTFLFYWLNAIIFCSRSIQMSKLFLPLAALLHEGKALNLAKLLLGHIFEELGQFVHCLQDNNISVQEALSGFSNYGLMPFSKNL
ncbi:hypothetical protein Ahy_A09g043397 [Arachis hypogaea]|uniref:Aminotransferase-like plant mobile domain-containing protein n=1 Tax=Arachis hypogaea TaxID=3818 RepID=A0A445BI62_ARAHY|nr:hypothetical protein Ahy_A09g043397 [Arachis hypogaea]